MNADQVVCRLYEARKRAVRVGFNMHLAKPIYPAEVLDVVASLA